MFPAAIIHPKYTDAEAMLVLTEVILIVIIGSIPAVTFPVKKKKKRKNQIDLPTNNYSSIEFRCHPIIFEPHRRILSQMRSQVVSWWKKKVSKIKKTKEEKTNLRPKFFTELNEFV